MKRCIVFTVILVMVCVTGASVGQVSGAPAGPPSGLDVTIINPLPVPVEGDVTATISSGSVEVTNDGTNPVPVSIINRQDVIGSPVRILLSSGGSSPENYTVPVGFRLKISHISIEVSKTNNNEKNDIRVFFCQSNEAGGTEAIVFLVPFVGPYPIQILPNARQYFYSSMVALVIDQNKEISLFAFGTDVTVTTGLVYGLLVPIN